MKWLAVCTIAILFLAACGTTQPTPTATLLPTVVPTSTSTPMPIITKTPLPTVTPTVTVPPSATALPTRTTMPTPTITYVTLGSPFAKDCGDGIPQIWSNKSFNGYGKDISCFDDWYGHVDLFVPVGCNIDTYNAEVVSPTEGELQLLQEYTYNLVLPSKVYILGIEDVLKYSGIESPSLSRIGRIALNFGHMHALHIGTVKAGEPIGNIVPTMGQHKLAYQISIDYENKRYWFSPTLFSKAEWPCIPGSPYPCKPEPNYMPPQCKN